MKSAASTAVIAVAVLVASTPLVADGFVQRIPHHQASLVSITKFCPEQQHQQQQSSSGATSSPPSLRRTALHMAKTITIDQWSIASNGGINGIVKDSPNPRAFKDGESLTTSKITTNRYAIKEGAIVMTASGSQYKLGSKRGTKKQQTAADSTNNTMRGKRSIGQNSNSPAKSSPPLFGGIGKTNSNTDTYNDKKRKKNAVDKSTVPIYTWNDKKPPQISLATRLKNNPLSKMDTTVNRDRDRGNTETPAAEKENNNNNYDDRIPVLDNWSLNRREEIVGIISNSPIPREQDGRTVTTKEVATDPAFVVEGFTVVTFDGRKYKLGTPKTQRASVASMAAGESTEEVVVWGTPTLADWDVVTVDGDDGDGDGRVRIEGIIQNTNDPKIPNGEVITTEEIITNLEFLAEGFSVVSSSGATYKLGRRDRSGVKRRQALSENDSSSSSSSLSSSPAFQLPSISVPEIKLPEVSAPKLPEIKAPSINNIFSGSTTGGTATTSSPTNPTTTTDSAPAPATPTLDNWTIGNLGRITGTITNSANGDNGQKLTTGQSTTPAILFRPGATVYGENGSAYKLGTKSSEPKAGNQFSIFRRNEENEVTIIALDDWSLTDTGCVTGIICDSQDPNLEDGDTLTTSKIVTVDIREGQVIETMNGSLYLLGTKRKQSVAERLANAIKHRNKQRNKNTSRMMQNLEIDNED